MAVTVNGSLPDGVTAKDLVLTLIAHTGTGGDQGYVVEYRGPAILRIDDADLAVEIRLSAHFEPLEGRFRWAGRTNPDQVLRDRCWPGLSGRQSAVIGHVLAWPVSVLATWGAQHRC